MIVVEGCDGSGKSTLVKKLVEQYGLQIGARGVVDRDFLWKVTRQDTRRALAEATLGDKPPTLWDRLFYSDFMYAPVTGRDIAFPTKEVRFIEGAIEALRCPVIVCHVPLDVATQNITKDKQMAGVSENLPRIWAGYQAFLEGCHTLVTTPPVCATYDYTTDDKGEQLEAIHKLIADYGTYREERNPWIR